MSWRTQDERLLRRLEDEALFERVWGALAPEQTEPPHPRAAGVLVALREDPKRSALLEAAERGDLAPLLRELDRPNPTTLDPEHAHHLALLWDRVADALAAGHPSGSLAARRRAMSQWFWLAAERRYLHALATQVIDTGLKPPQIERAAEDAPVAILDRLGAEAADGAESLADEARAAVAALDLTADACADAGCSEALTARLVTRARRLRHDAVDRALARVEGPLAQAILEQAPTSEIVAHLEDAARVWRWAGRDEQVERFLVQTTTPVIWDRYREKKWSEVSALLGPLRQPVRHLADRIRADSTKLAYAAPCAQMYVFMAEVAPRFQEQLGLAEEALQLCSTHRNGRLVLADLLVERGLRELDQALPIGIHGAVENAANDIRRARDLFPQLKRLESAKRRLKAKGVDLDAEP